MNFEKAGIHDRLRIDRRLESCTQTICGGQRVLQCHLSPIAKSMIVYSSIACCTRRPGNIIMVDYLVIVCTVKGVEYSLLIFLLPIARAQKAKRFSVWL